jgi:SAM-dependent methyltransferase
MDLESLKWHWDRFGASDPLWSVLTAPGRRFGGWDETEFFQTGVTEISRVFAQLDKRALTVSHGRALDFGCGVGRLTSALAKRFAHVDGVDIAPSMIAGARRRFGNDPRMKFHVIENDTLSLFPPATFDFIYSAHVLQHIEPRYNKRYVEEFLRVLAPTGLAVIEITTEPFLSDRVTVAHTCMNEEAFQVSIAITPLPSLSTQESAVVKVVVTNESSTTWRSRGVSGWYMVTVGNRWLDPDGSIIVPDDGRVYLPTDLAPGESVALDLEVRAPSVAGDYQLEVDAIQEGCAWFQDRGSTPARIPVRVQRAARPLFPSAGVLRVGKGRLTEFVSARLLPTQRTSALEEPPVMEMYGVPESSMVRWVEDAGGRIRDMFDWSAVGDPGTDWVRRVSVFSRGASG